MSQLWSLLLGTRCAACAQPASLAICPRCLERARNSPAVAGAVVPDSDGFDRMVRTFKRGVACRLGGELADLTLDRWRSGHLDLPPAARLDLVTWVPHAPARAATRGAHAPEVYARALGKRLGLPCRSLLRRCIEAPQRGRDIAGRREHAYRSFALATRQAAVLQPGLRVLVVDDVRTTGATLGACADLLQAQGLMTYRLAVVAVPRYTQRWGKEHV